MTKPDFLRVGAIATLVLLLAACATSKEYVEPDNPDVKACINDCQVVRTQCRAQGQDIYKRCKQNYEFQQRQYDYCRRTGNKACLLPQRCPPPETRHCTNRYDGCYQSCGGVITTGDGG